MAYGKSAGPSPESVARANRQRLAREEGVKAMADIEREAAAVRKNMERLRMLREASEAQAIATQQPGATKPAKKRRRATAG